MQNRIYILLVLFFVSSSLINAQEEWVVPNDKKDRLSPFAFNDSIQMSGKEIYYSIDKGSCVSCHGDPGKNNWIPQTADPNDPAGTKIQSNSDGELFYKIYEGRTPMPTFKETLTRDEIWAVISYLRSFNKDYVQEVAKEIIRKGYKGDVSILLSLLENNMLQSQVIGTSNNNSETLENVEVKLAAKRYFGEFTIDEVKSTNKEGIAVFSMPTDIPGDSEGHVELIAKLTNKELFGEVKLDTTLAIGVATNKPSLVAKRAMWNEVRMAPLWVIGSYSGGVILAWGIIFYILFQLKKIFEIGKKEEKESI